MPAEGHVFKHVSYLGKVTHSLENTVSSKSSWWGTWHRPSSQGAYGIDLIPVCMLVSNDIFSS